MIKVIQNILKTKIKSKQTGALKSKYSNIICDVSLNNLNRFKFKIKKRNKYKKLKIYIESSRRKRKFFQYKFLSKFDKFKYKKFHPIFQSIINKKPRSVKGVLTPKLNIKNFIEVISYVKNKLIKIKKNLYKKRIKRFYRWRWKKKKKFRRSGFFYVKKRKGRFQRLKRLNKRIFLFNQQKEKKIKNKFKVIAILSKKEKKIKNKFIKVLKKKNRSSITLVQSVRKFKRQHYPVKRIVQKLNNGASFLFKLRKILQVIGSIQLGNRNNLHRKQRIAILRSIVKVMYRIPHRINYFIKKMVNNSKASKNHKNQILKVIKLWKQISNKILLKVLYVKTKKNNLNLLYKEKVLELQKNKFNIKIQRQKNNLKIITLLIAKKREGHFIKNSENVCNYIKNEDSIKLSQQLQTNIINKPLFMNLNNLTNEVSLGSVISLVSKKSYSSAKDQKKRNIFQKYLRKNRIIKTNKTISVKEETGEQKQSSLKLSTRNNVKKKFRNKRIKLKGKKKITVNSFLVFQQNIKVTTQGISAIYKRIKTKKMIMRVGPHTTKRLQRTSNCKVWLSKIYKQLKEPVSILKQKYKKFYLKKRKQRLLKGRAKVKSQKRKIIKKVIKLKGFQSLQKKKKYKLNWLKKSEFKRNKVKRKKKGKRGRKNLQKRRKISKLSYYIRPRIINQKGLQAYSLHYRDRGLLFNTIKANKQTHVLRKKIFTKEKKSKLVKQLLTKYFNNQNKEVIIAKLKTLNVNQYIKQKGARYLNNTMNNFIQEYIKVFYVLVDSKTLKQKVEEKLILKKIKKSGIIFNVLGLKLQQKNKIKIKQKAENIRNWFNVSMGSKMFKKYIKKSKKTNKSIKKSKIRLVIRRLGNKKNGLIINQGSVWGLKKRDRLRLEWLRRKGSGSTKYYYKKQKCSVKRIKNISKKILKEHKKAKKKGQQIDKNLIKASYYYYFKRLRYDRVVLDKLNFKQKEFKMPVKSKIKLSKFLLYLLMRVYIKKTQLKRTNVRKGKRNIKKITKKKKITRKIKLVGAYLKNYTKPVRRRSKKYIGVIKKTIIIKVLIKLLRSLLKSTRGDQRELVRRRKIKEIIKIFLYPLLINKRQIKKIRLRKKNKIYLLMAQIFLYNIKQIVQSANYSINFFGIIGSSITAEYVMRRLMERLEQCKKTGFWLIPKAMKRLMNSKHIVGFKMKFSGRLTGNSMAQQSIMKKGIIGNSNMNVYIDYAQDNIIRKHGKCGLKIWIVRNLLTYMPYKYVYTYNFKN